MKTAGGYIGWFIGMALGAVISEITEIPIALIIVTIVCCLLGRALGEDIEVNKEKQKRAAEEAERLRKTREYYRRQAITLAEKYPEATKLYFKTFWGISKNHIDTFDITDDKVEKLLSMRSNYERDELKYNPQYKAAKEAEDAAEKQRRDRLLQDQLRRVREEKLREEQEIRNLPITLPACVSGWYTHTIHGSIKHKWFVDYYSYDKYKDWATREMRKVWKLVWNFKNGDTILPPQHRDALNTIANYTKDLLMETFNDKVKYLTFVCVAASNEKATKDRYEDFSYKVCKDLGMENGLSHIRIIADAIPKHLGGTGIPQKQYDSQFFNKKYIILFDDVRTTGASLEYEKNKLESLGATVIGAITIGQTRTL